MIRYLAVAVVAATLYAALGNAVSHAPPGGIDLAGRTLAGEAPRLALVFTASCWWEALVTLAVVMIAVAIRFPAWRVRVLYALPTTLITWRVSDVLKNVFHRPRPEYWTLIHETSFSYSSGHAMFALVVYALWAWFVWNSNLPRVVRLVVTPLLTLWAVAILWSRLALGAHYVTDLAGGLLLGTATLAVAAAIREALARRSRATRAATA